MDGYLAKEATGIARDMRGILKDSDVDPRARVAAGAELMKWMKPAKGFQVNVPISFPINSKLGLPPAPDAIEHERVIELSKPVQKILPEAPSHLTESLRQFSRKEIPPKDQPLPVLVKKAGQAPHAPDKPPDASTVKPHAE